MWLGKFYLEENVLNVVELEKDPLLPSRIGAKEIDAKEGSKLSGPEDATVCFNLTVSFQTLGVA